MRERAEVAKGPTGPMTVLLAACAVWLVVQNTVLAAALVWNQVPGVATATTAVLRTLLANGDLVRGWLLTLAGAMVLGLLVAASSRRLEREEARHG